MNDERIGGSQFSALCRMPDGSDVRVWAGKQHGFQRVQFGAKNPGSFSPDDYREIVRKVRGVALSCPFVRDHAHGQFEDGVRQEPGIPENQVEIKKGFNAFLLDFGRALKRQGFMPREARIESTIIGSCAVTSGAVLQRAIDE